MSTKTVFFVIIVLLIAGGIYYWLSAVRSSPGTVAPGAESAQGTSASDTSNAGLDADVSAADKDISAFSTDNADVNSSLTGSAAVQ